MSLFQNCTNVFLDTRAVEISEIFTHIQEIFPELSTPPKARKKFSKFCKWKCLNDADCTCVHILMSRLCIPHIFLDFPRATSSSIDTKSPATFDEITCDQTTSRNCTKFAAIRPIAFSSTLTKIWVFRLCVCVCARGKCASTPNGKDGSKNGRVKSRATNGAKNLPKFGCRL